MTYMREDVKCFIRVCEILQRNNLSETEKGLLEACVMRLWEELKPKLP